MMSSLVIQERAALIRLLEDCLGDLVQIVTADEQKARPLPNKVAVFIEPPELAYKKWGLDVIAGTMATQAPALELVMRAIDLMAEHELNIQAARPVTLSLSGAGDLAAYQLTLNPLEII